MTNNEYLVKHYLERSIPEKLRVHHGMVDHKGNDRFDCMDCIKVELFFLRELQKAGGQTKFLEKMRKEAEDAS